MENHEEFLNGGRCPHPSPRRAVPPAAPAPATAPSAGMCPVPGRLPRKRHGRLVAALTAVLTSAVTVVGTSPSSAAPVAVPAYQQQLGNDCEAASLRMVLAARGVQVSDQDVLGRIGVDLAHPQAGVSGSLSGDPFRAFVGNPNGSEAAGTGFGVYYPPIARAAQSYGLSVAAAGQGISPAQLGSAVAAGHLAIVWVDYNWRDVAAGSYTAYDGRVVPYAGPSEHTVVVTAVSNGQYLVNDPARGQLQISAATFAAGYASYGDMAVIVE
ncbi:C39 family peptidase [Kitasatospora sp. NPDC059648]|uniref:C39 family peptidase n=1 Tax=Kitasatospora sp. NPDC059648 TaxID=3346894 RepID=UPI00368A91DD